MEKGSTLLEILIAISVFSIAILSIAYLQGISTQNLHAAIELTKTTQQVDELIFRAR